MQQVEQNDKFTFQYFKEEEKFQDVKEIYNEELSATTISVAIDKVSKKPVIIKKIYKNKLNEEEKKQAILECELVCSLKHPNILTGCQKYENSDVYCYVMEQIKDADYFQDKLETNKRPVKNQEKFKCYILDVLRGVQYLHNLGYIHMDLKPANLFACKIENSKIKQVKIGDFGLIKKINPVTKQCYIQEMCGTIGYKAPEVQNKSTISQKCDMWSVGACFYLMAVGYMPHNVKGYKYGVDEVIFVEKDWSKQNPQLKQFIQKLLKNNPAERYSVEQALQDPFLTTSIKQQQ